MFDENRRPRPLRTGIRSLSSGRRASRRERRFRPNGGDEPLEARIVPSHGHGHAAIQVGALQPGQDHAFSGKVQRRSADLYEFQVNSPTIVTATLSGLSSNAELILLDGNKAQLSISSNGKADDSFRYTFSPGTYYAEVIGLARHKARYQLTITPTAPPAPKPTAPSQTTTGSSQSGGHTGGGSTGGGNAGGGTTGGHSSGITVQQFADALSSAISKVVNQFATDATLVEALAPTVYSNSVDPELTQVDVDAIKGNDFQAFADIQTLGQTLLQEAVYTVYWGLPDKSALLGYSQVLNDLETVVALKEISFAFLNYLASTLPTHASSTPAVWTTGLLGNGSSSGFLDQPSQSVLTGYSTSDLSRINGHLKALDGQIAANDLWYQEAQQFDPYQSLTEDTYDESYDPAIDPELTAIDNGE